MKLSLIINFIELNILKILPKHVMTYWVPNNVFYITFSQIKSSKSGMYFISKGHFNLDIKSSSEVFDLDLNFIKFKVEKVQWPLNCMGPLLHIPCHLTQNYTVTLLYTCSASARINQQRILYYVYCQWLVKSADVESLYMEGWLWDSSVCGLWFPQWF